MKMLLFALGFIAGTIIGVPAYVLYVARTKTTENGGNE